MKPTRKRSSLRPAAGLLRLAAAITVALGSAGCALPFLVTHFGAPCEQDDDCQRDYICHPSESICVPDVPAITDGGLVEGGCVSDGETLVVRGDDVDLLGCSGVIDGSLILEDVESLSSLESVTEIIGDLIIRDSLALDSLAGLDSVTTIDGDLELENTSASLDGISSLTSVGGDILLFANDQLVDLSPLQLLSFTGDFTVEENQTLTSMANPLLPPVIGSLRIVNNPDLRDLNGLEELEQIFNLEITGNTSLNDVSALCNLDPGLSSTGGIMGDVARVTMNPSLPNHEARCIVDDKIPGDNIVEVDNLSSGNQESPPGAICSCNE